MLGMIRCNEFKRKALDMAFAVADSQMHAAKDRERQKNREIIFRLMDITMYQISQGWPTGVVMAKPG